MQLKYTAILFKKLYYPLRLSIIEGGWQRSWSWSWTGHEAESHQTCIQHLTAGLRCWRTSDFWMRTFNGFGLAQRLQHLPVIILKMALQYILTLLRYIFLIPPNPKHYYYERSTWMKFMMRPQRYIKCIIRRKRSKKIRLTMSHKLSTLILIYIFMFHFRLLNLHTLVP